MQNCRIRLLGAVLAIGAVGCAGDPVATSRTHLARGDRFVEAGQFPEAAIEYRNAVKHAPHSVEGHSKLADAAAQSSDPNTALLEYLRIADLDPTDAAAQVRAAFVYLLAGRYEDARERAEAALRSAPADPGAHVALGEALAGLHDGARSVAALTEAVRLAPGSPEPHIALGSAYWAAGRAADADAELARAVEVGPSHQGAQRARALFLMAAGRMTAAEPHWTVVARTPGGDPFALADYYVVVNRPSDAERELDALARDAATRDGAALRLAPLRFERGDRQGAYAALDEVSARDSRHLPARLLRARLLGAEGRLDAALDAARSVATDEPGAARAALLEGEILAARGDDRQAVEAFELAERLDAADPAIAAALIEALVRTGQTVRAEIKARRAAERWPQQAMYPTLVGMVLEAQGHLAAAQAQYERTLARFPSAAVAANNLAWLYANAGRLDEALEWAGVAEQGMPRQAAVHDTLGWIHLGRDDVSRAVARFTRAVALDPENPKYRYHLALAYAKAGSPGKARSELRQALESARPFGERAAAAELAVALAR